MRLSTASLTLPVAYCSRTSVRWRYVMIDKERLIMSIWLTLASVLILTAFAAWRAVHEQRALVAQDDDDDSDTPPLTPARQYRGYWD